MKIRLSSRLLASLALAAVFATEAAAGPVTLTTGSWQTEPFTSMNRGDFFPTAYQAPVGEFINVSGYYVTGDYYSVYVNGILALTTKPVTPNVDYGDRTPPVYADPASAFSSGLFSTGELRVNAGDLITIADLYPPGGTGEVGIEAVPEPAGLALIGSGLLGLLLRRTRGVS